MFHKEHLIWLVAYLLCEELLDKLFYLWPGRIHVSVPRRHGTIHRATDLHSAPTVIFTVAFRLLKW